MSTCPPRSLGFFLNPPDSCQVSPRRYVSSVLRTGRDPNGLIASGGERTTPRDSDFLLQTRRILTAAGRARRRGLVAIKKKKKEKPEECQGCRYWSVRRVRRRPPPCVRGKRHQTKTGGNSGGASISQSIGCRSASSR